MKSGEEIYNELNALSPLLAGTEKINVFSVPAGYFDSLNQSVLDSIKSQEITLTTEISRDTFFAVPQGYFENLADNIMQKIKIQEASNELRDLSPMLYSIQNENVFTVPPGYFNNLDENILNKIKPQSARVIPMQGHFAFFKYAIAAAVICIIALGTYRFITKAPHNKNETTVASLDTYIVKGLQMNDKQFNDALSNLSDDEIANYLDKNVNESDMAELSSDIDDNSLPNQDDYLSNDKTLDNYLSGDAIKQTN